MFPIGDQIDPETPTDPNELVLYKKYGKNWRDVISGRKYSRDRGGNRDRGMRFMHTTPEGFMTRPTPPMSQQQMMRSDIDQSGYMSQMQKMQDDYNRMLQEWYSLTGSSAYQEQQDYYAGNYENMYGTGDGSQDNPYSAPPEAAPAAAAAVAAASSAAPAAPAAPAPVIPSYAGVQSSKALTGQAAYNAQMAQSVAREQASPAYRAPAAAAPAPALVPTAAPAVSRANPPAPTPTLNSYIQRYDRDESSPVAAPAKVVAPVKTVVKPATSFKKVKAM